MPKISSVVLDQISKLLSNAFEGSKDVPIPGKRRSTPYNGYSKPRCGPSSKGHITRSNVRPRKEDLCTRGSEDDDNNERTKLDEEHTPPPSQRSIAKVQPKTLRDYDLD